MEYLFIYLLQFADLIEALSVSSFIILLFLLIALIFVCLGYFIESYDDNFKKALIVLKKYTLIFFVTFVLLCLIPTKQTLLLCGGTYLGKKAVNKIVTNEKLKKIDTIINLELDKKIKELKEEK